VADTTVFINEFIDMAKAMEGIDKIQFFGSILNPERFRPGRSDVDLVIWGTPTREAKQRIRQILKNLSDKYGLEMEKAYYHHPVPFYIQDILGKIAFNEFIINMPPFVQEQRKRLKAAPSITIGERWDGKTHPNFLVRLAEIMWS